MRPSASAEAGNRPENGHLRITRRQQQCMIVPGAIRCGPRLAGARKPAPSAGSPSRPESRSGRRRARLSRLRPALALLLGALGLFVAAPPAEAQAPGAPTGLIVSARDTTLSLDWTAPAGTVTGYDVHYTSSVSVANSAAVQTTGTAATGWVAVDRSTSGTDAYGDITGLTNGTTYRVRVRAKNSNGNSGWVFGAGTPAVPPPPTNLVVTPGDRQLAVSWTAPANVASIAGYDLDFTSATMTAVANNAAASGTNPAVAWVATASNPGTTDTSYTITSRDATLVNGTTYRVRLRVYSPESAYVFGTGTPQAQSQQAPPTNLVVTPGDRQLAVSWTEPANANDIAAYDLEFTSATVTAVANNARSSGTDPTTAWVATAYTPVGGDTSHTITSQDATLVNGVTYRVRLRVSVPESAYVFATGTPVAAPVAPSVPRNVRVTPGDGKLLLTWEAPSSWGSLTPLGYIIEWKYPRR